jgi:hypothetical protein
MIQVDSELGVKREVGYRGMPILAIGIREQLTLHQRATGSTPVRPTNYINDFGRPRQHPVRGKVCFKPVSGNRATEFSCISSADFEFFDYTATDGELAAPSRRFPNFSYR